MYLKEDFKYSGGYHIVAGATIIMLACISLASDFSLLSIIISLLIIAIGTSIAYAGYRAMTAHRTALWWLIIFNGLQLLVFDFNHVYYQMIFGPYVYFDIFDPGLALGMQAQFSAGFSTDVNTTENVCKLSLLHLAFFVYFLDQLRFVPQSSKAVPWESEI